MWAMLWPADWLASAADGARFALFWGVLAVFVLAETVAPALSSSADRGLRWPTNFGLGLTNMILVPLAPLSGLAAAEWAQAHQFGILNAAHMPWGLTAIATLLIRSAAGYGLHIALHKIPMLWRVHRVHHADPHVDVSTSVRHHPLEMVVASTVLIVVATLCGLDPWALIAYELAEQLFATYSHANVKIRSQFEKLIGAVFVTPAMHRIHHSADHRQTDSNYGTVFSFWDRLFGTWRSGTVALLGLNGICADRASAFVWLLTWPFRTRTGRGGPSTR